MSYLLYPKYITFALVLSDLEFSICVLVDMRIIVFCSELWIVFLIETNNGHYKWMNQKTTALENVNT